MLIKNHLNNNIMEQNSTMTAQIGKIITNTLLKNQAIYLPKLGSLSVSTFASKVKSDSVTAPRRIVKFKESSEGMSIIDIIIHLSECEREVATELYNSWQESVTKDGVVEIEGVGTITNNKFTVSPQLSALLNPVNPKALALKKRKSSLMWVVLSVVGGVLVGVLANYMIKGISSDSEYEAPKSVVEQPKLETAKESVEAPAVVEKPAAVEKPKPVVSNKAADNSYRVISGVFSNTENAQKECGDAAKKNSAIVAEILPLGKMFMVCVYSSNNESECRKFMAANLDKFGDLWLHTKR